MALLEVECRNLITGLKLSDARCVELHAELDELHSQLDVAQSQLDVTQSQLGQLHSQLDVARSELGRERMQSAEQLTEQRQLTEQLTEQRQQSAELRIGLESAQRALEAAKAERACLERRQSEEEVR